ncbi:MAG: hypothetical protein ACHQX4_05100 [Gemmatimonadales bacterium]
MGDAETPKAIGWARPWAIARPFARPSPRAGAWYPVVAEADQDRVVLEIRGKRVAVQKHLVEIRENRPDKFTVVNRPKADQDAGEGGRLGRRYAVCPSCNARVPLWGEPPALTCGTCQHTGEVAYWETG